MAKHNATNISNETVEEALAIAKKTQKSGQSKEQTRLIAQGIQKGIAEYKKSVKAKQRQADKAQKKLQKQKQTADTSQPTTINVSQEAKPAKLPWVLLVASWGIFALYFFFTR
ncbi:DUF2956 domain-containing protein [Psychromonas sp. psych-6C06]|uniref:DUF2956 domain-containing protein n=1 Tax=Psychromonas sp. psych-6C06 TaxID=2058089 RepID=UPI000C34A4D0|nr:DUF2956 domain-containing protein [Psychromonas sp. psych-6C06]PKF60812.1 DUF2956 domain-containing protein [Psychromonas sp. psych-6C06]